MSCSRDDLGLSVPAAFLARGSSDQSRQRQRVHIGGLAEGAVPVCSLGVTFTQSHSATWLTLWSAGGSVGSVMSMPIQNRHQ